MLASSSAPWASSSAKDRAASIFLESNPLGLGLLPDARIEEWETTGSAASFEQRPSPTDVGRVPVLPSGASLAIGCRSCHRVPVLPKKGIPLTPWHPVSDPARRGFGSRLDGAFGDWATLFTPLKKLVAFSPIY